MNTDTLVSLVLAESARLTQATRGPKPPPWTDTETAYLRTHAGLLPEAEIAARLGRSINAIKVRRVRLMLPSRHSHPAFISATQAARLLGLDEHKIVAWIDSGLLPGETYRKQNTTGNCASGVYMRRVRHVTLKRWLTRPNNWIYLINPTSKTFLENFTRIPDPALRSLLLRAISRWGDEWWTTRQVADHHSVDPRWINTKIHRGELPARQAHNLGGRHPDGAWAFNFVRKTDALAATFLSGKGGAMAHHAEKYIWTPRADAWIIHAHAAGMPWTEIAARMASKRGYKWTATKVAYRARMLMEQRIDAFHYSPAPASPSKPTA